MTSLDDFEEDLRNGGFVQIEVTDLTNATKPFVAGRLAAWQKDSDKHKQDVGEDAYDAMETFYAVIARLFGNGSLGCVRLTASVH